MVSKPVDGILIAPRIMADADDTAKAILSLNLLSITTVKPVQMIAEFSNGIGFRTYAAERNPSFSANCNILNVLLHSPELGEYVTPISQAANFVCYAWHSSTLKDKWVRAATQRHTSH